MTRKHIPISYDEARELLGGRSERTIANNTRLVKLDGGTIGLQLHSTFVVKFYRDGSLTLNSGGYRTVTTKDRINRVIRPRGYSVFASKREWFVSMNTLTAAGTMRFDEGFEIPS